MYPICIRDYIFVLLSNKGKQKNNMGKQNTKQKKIINYTPGAGHKVRLRGKRLSGDKISLYLDYYQGYSKNDKGEIKTQRKIEYLKIYLTDNPRTQSGRQANKQSIELANSIRNKREIDLQHNAEGFISPYKKKINFFDYCQNYINSYTKKDIRMVKGAVNHFQDCIQENYITANLIDKRIITKYKEYLINKFNGETPNSYFARFKKILSAATEEGLFNKNPAEKITCPVPDGVAKDILMPNEIIKFAKAECGNPEVKRAFLFSLNTGLRFVDIIDLRYKHIQGDLIIKRQQKTGKQVTIDLNHTAMKLMGKSSDRENLVFDLPSFASCLKTLKLWSRKAGINKNLTWHSARHSFATILLINKTDIKTVSGLLGHSRLEHTQKYTHIVNELKRKAVNSLPELDL